MVCSFVSAVVFTLLGCDAVPARGGVLFCLLWYSLVLF